MLTLGKEYREGWNDHEIIDNMNKDYFNNDFNKPKGKLNHYENWEIMKAGMLGGMTS